jgi:hypothetical protein
VYQTHYRYEIQEKIRHFRTSGTRSQWTRTEPHLALTSAFAPTGGTGAPLRVGTSSRTTFRHGAEQSPAHVLTRPARAPWPQMSSPEYSLRVSTFARRYCPSQHVSTETSDYDAYSLVGLDGKTTYHAVQIFYQGDLVRGISVATCTLPRFGPNIFEW